MGVKFQTKEMERTVVYRFKSQKVMKYNFKQKRWKKRKNLFKQSVEKGEQNGRNFITGILKDS